MLNFIVNAHSGRGKGLKTIKKLIDFCSKINVEYTVHFTGAKGHATRITTALCENNSRTLVAVGGDGTFHEILNGITNFEKTALGFIPSGRGNDFARGIGLPSDPIQAVKLIIENKERRIDYIQVGDKRCLNVCGTGLDIDVLKRVDGRNGKITYLSSLIYCLKHFEPYKLKVIKNGQEEVVECIVAGVCNGTQYGGGIKLSPISKVDDGLLDVIVMKMPKNKKIFSVLPKFLRGKHLSEDFTTHFTCEEVKIESLTSSPIQLDGEIYDNLILDCKVIKGGLRTFL